MKIVHGRKVCKMRLQNPSLLTDVLKAFVFEFNHQVHPSTESLHHLFEGGDQGAGVLQDPVVRLPNPDGSSEQPPTIRIVNYNRMPVAGPTHIELDSPDTTGDGYSKSRHRVLDDLPVVVLTAVGDDPASREAPSRRTGLRIEPKEGIRAAKKGVFDPRRKFHGYITFYFRVKHSIWFTQTHQQPPSAPILRLTVFFA
jgi:hypothetical protein